VPWREPFYPAELSGTAELSRTTELSGTAELSRTTELSRTFLTLSVIDMLSHLYLQSNF
tara:strand:- start:297 stop:473 length:177 start_codon:yes stop_codon:yes gene_type:complete